MLGVKRILCQLKITMKLQFVGVIEKQWVFGSWKDVILYKTIGQRRVRLPFTLYCQTRTRINDQGSLIKAV